MLALEGKADFVSQTNPFGPSKPVKKTDKQNIQDQRNLFYRMKMDAAQAAMDKREKNGK